MSASALQETALSVPNQHGMESAFPCGLGNRPNSWVNGEMPTPSYGTRCAKGAVMKIDRFVAQFSFLGNGELIPNANEVEVVRISRISYELLAIRPRVESENGNLVDCLHEDRVWPLARDGNVRAEVKYQEEKIVHGAHGPPWQHQGESVGDTV